jgi:hypothetical protein
MSYQGFFVSYEEAGKRRLGAPNTNRTQGRTHGFDHETGGRLVCPNSPQGL